MLWVGLNIIIFKRNAQGAIFCQRASGMRKAKEACCDLKWRMWNEPFPYLITTSICIRHMFLWDQKVFSYKMTLAATFSSRCPWKNVNRKIQTSKVNPITLYRHPSSNSSCHLSRSLPFWNSPNTSHNLLSASSFFHVSVAYVASLIFSNNGCDDISVEQEYWNIGMVILTQGCYIIHVSIRRCYIFIAQRFGSRFDITTRF